MLFTRAWPSCVCSSVRISVSEWGLLNSAMMSSDEDELAGAVETFSPATGLPAALTRFVSHHLICPRGMLILIPWMERTRLDWLWLIRVPDTRTWLVVTMVRLGCEATSRVCNEITRLRPGAGRFVPKFAVFVCADSVAAVVIRTN